MMLALTAKEVRSLGKALTFRAVREQGAGLYLIRGRSRDGEEREGERQKKRKEGEHEVGRGGGEAWVHGRDCSYDVHEGGRQWTTGRESLKGTASVGWQDGRRERGKYATAERDKCRRTNRWWLMGSFIHSCDQIQQDSPPYGMAQLIHPITWTAYRTRGGRGGGGGGVCVSVRVCAEEKVPEGFLNVTSKQARKWGEQGYFKEMQLIC